MSGDHRPSYEELAVLVAVQAERIGQLEAQGAELTARWEQNSRNSSKPPSSDSLFSKPAPKSLRSASGRKPGGHSGSTLAQVVGPDERLRHEPGRCGVCGAGLADAPQVSVERRQVFDLPSMRVQVTEPQLIARRCPCGRPRGTAPAGVVASVQYGPRITAIIVYLYAGQFCPKNVRRRRWRSCLAALRS